MDEIRCLVEDIIQLNTDKISNLKEAGGPKIGWLSIHSPEEILLSAGCVPYRITGESAPESQQASAYMHRNICSYVLASLEEALEGVHDFLDGVLIVNSCDALRRLHDVWKHKLDTRFLHLLDIPKSVSPHTKMYFKSRIIDLIKSLENRFDCAITSEDIARSMALCNETRSLLGQLDGLRLDNTDLVTGSQMLSIGKASLAGSKKDFNIRAKRLIQALRNREAPNGNHSPRIFICGSYFDHGYILDLIENTGATAIFQNFNNEIQWDEGDDQSGGDPVTAIADYYMDRSTCARMIHTENRVNELSRWIRQHRVDRVIYFVLKFCDNNLLDFPYLKEKLSEQGIPLLFVEDEYPSTDSGQIKTRIQAFLE